MVGPHVHIKPFRREEVLKQEIFAELAKRKSDVFPLFLCRPGLAAGAKTDDPPSQIQRRAFLKSCFKYMVPILKFPDCHNPKKES